MLRKPQYIVFGVILVLTLVLLKLPPRASSQLKLLVSGLFIAPFGAATSADHLAHSSSAALATREDLVRQIEDLQKEREEWRIQAVQLEEAARENSRLRQLVGFAPHIPWKRKLAHVIARDPANWWRSLKIDAGLRDDVVTNCTVFTAEGLVGRVSESGYTQATVVLLGDPYCRVSAMIEETRDSGFIAPASSSPLDNIIVDLSNLSRNSPIRPGQRVITSGLGGVFPKGILIGHIVDYHSVGFGLYNEARVKVAVRLNALEEVWVRLPDDSKKTP